MLAMWIVALIVAFCCPGQALSTGEWKMDVENSRQCILCSFRRSARRVRGYESNRWILQFDPIVEVVSLQIRGRVLEMLVWVE